MAASDPRQLFEAFLARAGSGTEADLERLVGEHPEHEAQLRSLWSERQQRERPSKDGSTPGLRGLAFHGRRHEPLPPPPAGVAAGALLGDFRLVQRIGEGGMGQVWEAEQVSLRRRVALKLLRPDRVTQKALDFFAREARAGGRLQHRGLVNVYGHGENHGVAWIAMELVDGSWTLRDFIDEIAKEEELPPTYYTEVAGFVAKLADALEAAHQVGVIHRDLKPQNVLITPQDEPKVTDFGLARITDETSLSVTGESAGTYYYMSPEQVTGERDALDQRTDLFSLGIVLYELLALRRPFEGDTGQQIGQRILHSDPPELLGLRSRIPRELAVICGKCLEKEPERRYRTMVELAADLRRYLANEPIHARPPTSWERAVKWSKRNPTKSVAAVVAALAFIVISLLLAENVRARGEVERKNTELDVRNADLARTVGERDEALEELSVANEDLAQQTGAARSAASAEKARVDEVLRLSALQDYDERILEADRLWPPHPEIIDACVEWIAKTERLVADLPLHREKRDELRRRALAQTDEERETDFRSHPDYARIAAVRAEIAARRAAVLQRREGLEAPLPELDRTSLPEDAGALLELAAPKVALERGSFGGEAEGLVLARRALELAEEAGDDARVAQAEHVLSCALFALGRDEEALESAATAQAVAPEKERAFHEKHLAQLERDVEERTGEQALADEEAQLARLESGLAVLEERASERRTWCFPETEEGSADRWWYANLTKLIEALEGLQDPGTGLLSDAPTAISTDHGWSVPRRLAFARRLRDDLAEGAEVHARWQQAIAAIGVHPDYGGLALAPQVGLIPLGPDPASGLWEFWHVASGVEPARNGDGRLQLDGETGVVLVLVPAGAFHMGAQAADPNGRNYDPRAQVNEGPVHEVELSPYFIAKHEMTQGQWLRTTGANPSYYQENELAPTLLHPVEQVNWLDCMTWLPRVGLTLPTEAQWEHACRAGTDTPWWTGSERESLRERKAANLADRAAARHGATWPEVHDWPELDDGFVVHAPVGTFTPNAFGLHEMTGNLWEWCRDGFDAEFYRKSSGRDPECSAEGAVARIIRGGAFLNSATEVRSAIRSNPAPTLSGHLLGVRPARVVSRN